MKSKWYASLALLLSLLLSSVCSANEYVETGRYELTKVAPTSDELDPLSVKIQMSFPPHVVTVREAIEEILKPSGWILAEDKSNDAALTITLDRPLPEVHRSLSLMPLRTALQVLVGRYFEPVEDPIRRIYTFDLNEDFRGLVND